MRTLFSLVVLTLVVTESLCAQRYPRTLYPWSLGPGDLANVYDLEFCDLDGDGNLDVVGVIRLEQGSLRVAFGDGSGTMGPIVSYPVGDDPEMVLTGDANNDGFDDVFVPNEGDATLSVFISDGNRGWAQQSTLTLQNRTNAFTVGDVNGDTYLDLLAVAFVTADLEVFLGDGNGGFAAPLVYPQAYCFDLAVGDVNKDTFPDLVFSDFQDVNVWLGDGLGGYPTRNTYLTTFFNLKVTLDDMDNDGWLDIVTSGGLSGDGSVAVLLNDQTGAFPTTDEYPVFDVPNQHATLDLSMDGFLDVVVDSSWVVFETLRNDGSGGLNPAKQHYTQYNPINLTVGDLNNDGEVDVGLTAWGHFVVHMADGQGGFVSPEASDDPGRFALGDVNRDGHVDAVGVSTAGLVVAAGDGTGAFVSGLPQGPAGRNAFATRLTDLNGDGEIDVVAALTSDEIVAYLGDGLGNFTDQGSFATDPGANDLGLGDLNGDNLIDAVTSNRVGFPNASSSISIFLGQGDGSFQSQTSVPAALFARALAVFDVNEDNLDDVVVATSDRPSVFLADGAGSVFLSTRIQAADKATGLYAADVNDDRVKDLVVIHDQAVFGSTVEIHPGDGLGGFLPPVALVDAPDQMGEVTAADLDGDGSTELLLLGDDREILTYRQDGLGGWVGGFKIVSTSSQGDTDLTVADVNSDGRLDVVARTAEIGGTKLYTWLDGTALDAGVNPFGTGTPGCLGQSTLIAASEPTVGSNEFGVYCTNVPENAVGLLMIGTQPDLTGTNVGGLVFHIDLVATSFLMLQPYGSGTGPGAFLSLPIPNWPQIAGASATVQAMWQWPRDSACAPSSSYRGMSSGLTLVFQP